MENFRLNSVGKAEEFITQAKRDGLSNAEISDYLYHLVDSLLDDKENKRINGNADDFHNFGVTILKNASDYETALEIIQRGLEIHKTNTDLLADAIRYGYNCGKYEKCENWFSSLQKIPKTLWTWRAFSFSIDYMIDNLGALSDESEYSVDLRINEIVSLAKSYQKFFPDNEDSYVCEYEIYRLTNQTEKGLEVLRHADQVMTSCPKCWLRYADIMMERNNFEEAEVTIKKLRTGVFLDSNVNMSYVFYLDGMCRMAKLLPQREFPEIEVNNIYKSFKMANDNGSLSQSSREKMLNQIKRLELESGFDCPFEIDE